MKIAVLSDIHGNYIALQKCVDYVLDKGIINTFIFLGDYVGELAYPQKTMGIIYSLKEKYNCFFIKGNKEDYWLNYQTNGEKGWNECDSTGIFVYIIKMNYQCCQQRCFIFSRFQRSSTVFLLFQHPIQ